MIDDATLGGVFMVAPPDGWQHGDTAWLDALQPAGVLLFRRNLPDTPQAARAAIARLHAWAEARGRPFLVAMDEEGGFVSQLGAYLPVPPTARACARAGRPEWVREAFAAYGRRMRQFGVNVDFAPVVDVNDNPRNPVIGARAYGTDPDTVVRFADATLAGLRDAGVAPTLKHFPGHGDTDLDSHLTLPTVHHERARFEAVELAPFRALLHATPLVMVAHLACPGLGGGEAPATLAPAVATGLLRDALGFDGVAVTDAMEMKGVAEGYGTGEAAVRALQAGCDLLLYAFEFEGPLEARDAVRTALERGSLAEERVREAAARVERLAQQVPAGLDDLDAGELADPPEQALYARLCRAALCWEDRATWQALAAALRAGSPLQLASTDAALGEAVAARLRARGVHVEPPRPVTAETLPPAPPADTPYLALLAERRPLQPAVAEALCPAPGRTAPAALANLLTPEVDAPLRAAFAARIQTCDASDTMLDVWLEAWWDAAGA